MRFYTRKRRQPSIMLVSLIDILAILLIFFIVTTTFRKTQPHLQINLPESRTAELAPAASDAPLLLEVKGETEISFDGSLVPIEELAVRVRAAREAAPERLIAMQADREAAFGVVVKVLDALKEAGVDKLPAFTQPRESSQP